MKVQTTKKSVQKNSRIIVSVSYCGLQYLESCGLVPEPFAYVSGIYGWNADIRCIEGITIVDGYRPFGVHCAELEYINKRYGDASLSYEGACIELQNWCTKMKELVAQAWEKSNTKVSKLHCTEFSDYMQQREKYFASYFERLMQKANKKVYQNQ